MTVIYHGQLRFCNKRLFYSNAPKKINSKHSSALCTVISYSFRPLWCRGKFHFGDIKKKNDRNFSYHRHTLNGKIVVASTYIMKREQMSIFQSVGVLKYIYNTDPDQSPRSVASYQGLPCLLRSVCPNKAVVNFTKDWELSIKDPHCLAPKTFFFSFIYFFILPISPFSFPFLSFCHPKHSF